MKMTTIEISKEEYNSLLKTKADAESLKSRVSELETESKNKAIALDEERKKLKQKTEEVKNLLSEKEKELGEIKNLFELKEWETFEERVKSLKENNEKYSQILKEQEKQRQENILNYKKFLWEDFMKEKSIFFEWLSDEKTEMLLKDYAESKWYWEENKQKSPTVGINKDGDAPDGRTSDFDKALTSWVSTSELMITGW